MPEFSGDLVGHSVKNGLQESLLIPQSHPFSALQKAWLGSLLFLATLVIASKAECTIRTYERLPNQTDDECTDTKGIKHALYTPWKLECLWCICDQKSILCCSNTPRPLGYDKEKCEKDFYPENCTYGVMERENPGKICPVFSWLL
ncbi:beta-microseminoprotein-like [Apodemus sylvaticus]|uniref:beta-microseminoprotein-like n=1 Tax=Apodemus sylvaticus TaxID=10129 RepID=UPI002244F143|nr:beta-microseminoprotein-like [Apodemus sylvaticus]